MWATSRKCVFYGIFKNTTKHQKIFFEIFFEMQPNTWKHFLFRKIAFPENIYFPEILLSFFFFNVNLNLYIYLYISKSWSVVFIVTTLQLSHVSINVIIFFLSNFPIFLTFIFLIFTLLQPFFLPYLFISSLPSTLISFFLFPFIFIYFCLFLFTHSYYIFVTISSILYIVFPYKKRFSLSLSLSIFW